MHPRLSAGRRLALALVMLLAAVQVAAPHAVAAQTEIDEQVPPGNPVIGSDAPGDSDVDNSNYGLLALIAVGLVGAGLLLVRVERWERRRTAGADASR